MKKNVGKADKNIRILLGIITILFGFTFQSWWGLIGIPLIITALIGWCPAYLPLGISKNKKTEVNNE
jgi:hypothetical protein